MAYCDLTPSSFLICDSIGIAFSNDRLQLGWNLQRTLAKINYRIHTDAIKETLIPEEASACATHADRRTTIRPYRIVRFEKRVNP